ncbi:hypothetical protein RISK_002993 [Rhodopirellula islandica]|uniref:Uncharacterized protein n=1 Tax=Rhodopirellula islandica TaxID=595434 RepID=A0A0J1BEP7_RHOIS|nr:hypothetical protein RISK_002993 [Rhodopirellula islandica]
MKRGKGSLGKQGCKVTSDSGEMSASHLARSTVGRGRLTHSRASTSISFKALSLVAWFFYANND